MIRYSYLCGSILLSFLLIGTSFAAPSPSQPNILFIALDDLNDWVGCLGGNLQSITPNIDRLAASGVLFTNAHTPAAACNPSRTAIMTGISPHRSGLYANGQKMREVLPQAELLSQRFRNHGYRASGSGKILHYFIDARSWDEYFPAKQNENPFPPHMPWGKRPKSLPRGGPWQYSETDWHAFDVSDEEFGGDWLVSKWVGEQLQRKHEKPFFLACGIYRPHEPWYVPKKYFEPFPLENIQLPPGYKEGDLEDLPPAGKKRGPNRYFAHIQKHAQWKRGIQAYLASIHYADAMLGRVLDALDTGPNKKNTIVVLWSDHGWHLGEKQHWQKYTAWRAVTRVPLIIKVPEKIAPSLPEGTLAGSICDRPVNLLSLYPTLSELAGLTPKSSNDAPSLIPLLKDPQAKWDHHSITHLDTPDNYGLSTENWRYIHYSNGDEELYNIKDDPYEWNNLAAKPEHAEKLISLHKLRPRKFAPKVVSKSNPAPASTTHSTLSLKGWTIQLNDQLKRDDPKAVETMLSILNKQLDRVVKAIPAKALKSLRTVPIWINPPYDGKTPGAAYHPNINWLRENDRDPAMAKAIEITNVSIFAFENKRMPYLMLHELAHAYHDQYLAFDQPEIRAAFERARASKSYDKVQRFNGKKIVTDKAYAMSNYKEYFAEASEAYFGKNDFFPFNKRELKAHDPKMHDLVEKVWGIDKNPPHAKSSQVKPIIPSSYLAFTTDASTQCPPSTNGGGKTSVVFRNNRSTPVTVFWIDAKGKRAQQFTISPGGQQRRITYAGHAWLVADDKDADLGHFVATDTPAWADIPAIRLPSNHGKENNAARYPITAPPAELKLDPFYQKYLNFNGFPILSSEKVSDYAIREAAYLLQMMLAQRPDVLDAMAASGARLTVMAHNEFTTDVPEHARMGKQKGGESSDWWDRRARGLGGSETDPVASCGEENLLCFPGDPYSQENILIHEFAHMMHLRGLKRIDPTFDSRLEKSWTDAMAAGLWKDKYPSTNSREYFAEGVQSWFNNNRENDYEHNHINTRKELIEYDPQLAAILKEVFGDTQLIYIRPPERKKQAHLEGYDYSKSPRFEWPERLKNLGQSIETRRNKK
ncbi:MAG: sulfatase-like hydrolase/transferase [Verrucomicrobiota bacterium]